MTKATIQDYKGIIQELEMRIKKGKNKADDNKKAKQG